MKVDNECLRTSGKGEITEFLNYLSKSEENKQLLNLFEKHIV